MAAKFSVAISGDLRVVESESPRRVKRASRCSVRPLGCPCLARARETRACAARPALRLAGATWSDVRPRGRSDSIIRCWLGLRRASVLRLIARRFESSRFCTQGAREAHARGITRVARTRDHARKRDLKTRGEFKNAPETRKGVESHTGLVSSSSSLSADSRFGLSLLGIIRDFTAREVR